MDMKFTVNDYITYYIIAVYAYTTKIYTPFETLFKCYNIATNQQRKSRESSESTEISSSRVKFME